jgi:predicted phosphodiesterase
LYLCVAPALARRDRQHGPGAARNLWAAGGRIAVYADIHRPDVRPIGDLTVANTGSVALPMDGITRASYLVIDDGRPEIRRGDHDVERSVADVLASSLPEAELVASLYRNARWPG